MKTSTIVIDQSQVIISVTWNSLSLHICQSQTCTRSFVILRRATFRQPFLP